MGLFTVFLFGDSGFTTIFTMMLVDLTDLVQDSTAGF